MEFLKHSLTIPFLNETEEYWDFKYKKIMVDAENYSLSLYLYITPIPTVITIKPKNCITETIRNFFTFSCI